MDNIKGMAQPYLCLGDMARASDCPTKQDAYLSFNNALRILEEQNIEYRYEDSDHSGYRYPEKGEVIVWRDGFWSSTVIIAKLR